jgi:AraC family transcriptional regulator
MRDLLPIYRAIEFVEVHLRDQVTVADMAAAAGYSVFHFIRAFNQIVRHTPYDYLMRRRLSAIAAELVTGRRRVLDIAIDYHFNSHETFARAFKRLFGMQPIQWRARGLLPAQALMPALSMAYLTHINRPDFAYPWLVTRETRRLAGLMTWLVDGAERATACMEILGQLLQTELPVECGHSFFGVSSYLDRLATDTFYMAGFEIRSGTVAPPLVCQTLPAGPYVCLSHPGPAADLAHSLAYLYHTWLPQNGCILAHRLEIVAYGAAMPSLGTAGPQPCIEIPVSLDSRRTVHARTVSP